MSSLWLCKHLFVRIKLVKIYNADKHFMRSRMFIIMLCLKLKNTVIILVLLVKTWVACLTDPDNTWLWISFSQEICDWQCLIVIVIPIMYTIRSSQDWLLLLAHGLGSKLACYMLKKLVCTDEGTEWRRNCLLKNVRDSDRWLKCYKRESWLSRVSWGLQQPAYPWRHQCCCNGCVKNKVSRTTHLSLTSSRRISFTAMQR